MNKIFSSNDARYRLARTIIQGVIGVIIANADFLFNGFHFQPETKAFIVALTMAILSPIMAELGHNTEQIQNTFNNDGIGAQSEVENNEDQNNDSEE